jgi:hypothetical protein
MAEKDKKIPKTLHIKPDAGEAIEHPESQDDLSFLLESSDSLACETSEILSEVENFPNYEFNGNTVVLDGQVVNQEELLEDYRKLKTEIRKLGDLSDQLTREVSVKLPATIETERRKRKKLAGLLITVLVLGSICAGAAVYYLNEKREKDIVSLTNKVEQEKLQIKQQLEQKQKEEQEKLALVQTQYDAKFFKLQEAREKELANLQQELSKQSAQQKLTSAEQQKREEGITQEYKNLVEKLHEQVKQEKKMREEDLGKTQTLMQRLQQLSATEDPPKGHDKELKVKQLVQEQKELHNIREAIAKDKESPQPVANVPNEKSEDLAKTDEASPKANKDLPKTAATLPEATKELIPVPSEPTYDARKLIENYYYQKVVKTEQVEISLVVTGTTYRASIYTKNDLAKNLVKELIKLESPLSEKGNGYLSIIDMNASDFKVWHYSVAQHKEYRVPTSQRRERLLDSEFTYEDWLPEDLNKYRYTYIKMHPWRERNAHIIMAEPIAQDEKDQSQYAKKYYWLDTQHFSLLQAKFFGKDQKLLKIFAVKKMTNVVKDEKGSAIWRPIEAFMVNVRTERKTTLYYSNWRINIPLEDDKFTLRALSTRK